MKKLSSYIFRQLFFSVSLVVVVLSCIMCLVQSLRYIELISSKNVSFLLFLEMIGYLFPNIFVIIVPISLLLGVLFVYNKLIVDHELIAMQAAGASYWKLTKPVLLVSLLLTVFLYSLTLYFLPLSFRKHRDLVLLLKQESLTSLISDGRFSTFKTYTAYAHRKLSPGHFLGVLLCDGSTPEKRIFFMAEEGIIVNKKEGTCFLLLNGNRQENDLKTGKPSILYFKKYTIDSKNKIFENKKEERFIRTHERSTAELFNPEADLDLRLKEKFLVALHQRLLLPLYAIAFGLLGASTMLLGQFNRRGRASKVTLACTIAFLVEVVEMVLFHEKGGRFNPWPCYGLIFLLIGSCGYLITPLRFSYKSFWGKGT